MVYKKHPKFTDTIFEKQNNWPLIILIGIVIGFFSWNFGVKPIYKEFKDNIKKYTPADCPDTLGDILDPGYHLVDKWPFIVTVPVGKIGVLRDGGYYYHVRYYNHITIPQGYVGIVESCKGINSKTLSPGIYKINLDMYKVSLVDTTPKTYTWGTKDSKVPVRKVIPPITVP